MLQWIWMYKYLFTIMPSILLGIIPISRIAGSYSTSIFKILRNCCFPQWLPHSTFLPTGTSLSISSHLCQYFLFSVLLIAAILVDMRYCLIIVWVCISLMISEVKHFFMCFLAIHISSLKKCLYKSCLFLNQSIFVILTLLAIYLFISDFSSAWNSFSEDRLVEIFLFDLPKYIFISLLSWKTHFVNNTILYCTLLWRYIPLSPGIHCWESLVSPIVIALQLSVLFLWLILRSLFPMCSAITLSTCGFLLFIL